MAEPGELRGEIVDFSAVDQGEYDLASTALPQMLCQQSCDQLADEYAAADQLVQQIALTVLGGAKGGRRGSALLTTVGLLDLRGRA
ncbi:hypothetical protein ACIQCJ_24720 [Streptomyces sp. NPDC093221]|uniref:hypothetical protein n=1 Tax=Streptomyces sp. NPDC093221 TaxID=3366032 RepID=UPI003819F812